MVKSVLFCFRYQMCFESSVSFEYLRQLPTSINKRISTLSSDKQTFEDAAPAYQNALGHSNFSHKLEYTPHETQRPRRNRQRNVIWFNPPFSKNVKTNIARSFLHLVDTHFPAGHKPVARPARHLVMQMQIFLCLDRIRNQFLKK